MERAQHTITVNVNASGIRAGFGGTFQQEMQAMNAAAKEKERLNFAH